MLTIGMITCDRPTLDLSKAIMELQLGAFNELVHLFCEPGTREIQPTRQVVYHHNERRLGVLGNWAHCLKWLVENTAADYVMVCEDDVTYCKGAHAALLKGIKQFDRVGFWSLYTPRRDRGLVGHQEGWVASNRGRDSWGTQAMCFPRSSAEILLKYRPLHEEDQLRGPTDAIVAQCFLDAGIPCYYHNPSLADHIGRLSSVGHNWDDAHVGLNFDRSWSVVDRDPVLVKL